MRSVLLLLVIGIVAFVAAQIVKAPRHRLLTDAQIAQYTKLTFYYGPSLDTSMSVDPRNIESIFANRNYKHGKPLMIYCHGWLENKYLIFVSAIPFCYAKRGDWNVILIDWDSFSDGPYPIAWYNSIQMCKYIASILFEAYDRHLFDINDLHLVGHSLGAQCCGIIGQYFRSNGVLLPRITALDAANPLFHTTQHALSVEHLSAADAKCVDAIHTDGGVYGMKRRIGTVDFYPNGGVRPQNVCPRTKPFDLADPREYCSHLLSVAYFARSVCPGALPFYAALSDSWQSFQNHTNTNYEFEDLNMMGIDCNCSRPGAYYLQTAPTKEVSLGLEGIYYKKYSFVQEP